jgi:hypothetical protein
MAGAHDEAPDGVENRRERAERFNIVVHTRAATTGSGPFAFLDGRSSAGG